MKKLLKAIALLLSLSSILLLAACGTATQPNDPPTDNIPTATEGTQPPHTEAEMPDNNSNSNSNNNNVNESNNNVNNNENNTLITPPITGGTVNVSGVAKALVNSFGSVPDTWSFLPESFSVDNYEVNQAQIPTYTDFTNVSAIPQNYIGKQMNVVVGTLNMCEVALGYVSTVHGALNIVEGAYQAFINDNPDNYKQFSGSTESFSYNITLQDNAYLLSASIGAVKVTLFSSTESSTYGARIQLSDSNVIKYTVTESGLLIAMNILNSSTTQIEFVRDTENPQNVLGYIYEYLTVSGHELVATSTLLNVTDSYTTVVGTKGDFIPTAESRNCEVYDTQTGRLIGTEVMETLGNNTKTYNTLWYNLKDITGITSIKKIDDYNGVNPDTIYINGKSDTIHSMFVNGILDTSRRFDIEFKTVTAYVYDEQSQSYSSVEYEVPMMFIQENNFDTFADDYESKNDVTVSVSVSNNDRNAVYQGYHVLVNTYNTIKNLVTQQSIIDYCSADFTL